MKYVQPDLSAAIVVAPCRTKCTVFCAPPRLRVNQARRLANYEKGFLLPAAIFLVVILAGLGAYAVNISTLQQATSTQDVQGARAYQMARAGVEWAAYQVLAPGTANLANCPASPTVLAIEGFSVSVSCSRSADFYEQDTDHTIAMYDIVATATFGVAGTAGYIERQVQVTLSKCRGTDAATPYQCA
jgi:MSHA biogenesis protein MshP